MKPPASAILFPPAKRTVAPKDDHVIKQPKIVFGYGLGDDTEELTVVQVSLGQKELVVVLSYHFLCFVYQIKSDNWKNNPIFVKPTYFS